MRMKMESYRTVSAASAIDLDEQVNYLIKEGYQPFGSPYFVAPKSQGLMSAEISPFNQAMVKFTE
jgi:hypothetical protein